MGEKRLEDLDAFNLATAFKLEVYKLITEHPKAERDFKYAGELREAVSSAESNLAEGWRRYRRRDMANLVRIALASVEESKVRLRDGIAAISRKPNVNVPSNSVTAAARRQWHYSGRSSDAPCGGPLDPWTLGPLGP
jgi:four helix bundle protein